VLEQVKTLRMSHLKTLRNHGGQDRAVLELDLDADLRSAFHWNLKQLFVYVVAEYESKKNKLNQVVIWDAIIQSVDDAHIQFHEQSVKYALIDQGSELRNKTITLKLQWDHMPLTGRMYIHEKTGSQFTLPGKYVLK
jgi:signal peptidase complex subunit 3